MKQVVVLVVAGLACGAAGVYSTSLALVVAGVSLGALLVLAVVVNSPTPDKLCRFFAWIGLMAPLALTQARTGSEIQGSAVTPFLVAQGLLTGAALVLVLFIGRPRLFPLRVTERWLVAFAAIAIVSTAWSTEPVPTALVAADLAVVYLLLIALMRLQERAAIDPLRGLARVVHVSLGATLVGFLLVPGEAYRPIGGDTVERLRGVFPPISPDALGLLCAAAIVLVVAGYAPFRANRKFLNAAAVAADIGMLLLSRARTGLLLLVLAMATYYFLRRGGWRALLGSAAVGLLGFVTFAAAGDSVAAFLSREQSKQNITSLTGRTDLWNEALDAWEQRPLIGYGFYSGHRFQLGPLAVAEDTPSNIDSLWVETVLDLGLVGLVALSMFVGSGARRVFARRPDGKARSVVGRRCLFLACLLSSFVNPSLQKPSFFLLLFAFAVLAPMPRRPQPAAARAEPTPLVNTSTEG